MINDIKYIMPAINMNISDVILYPYDIGKSQIAIISPNTLINNPANIDKSLTFWFTKFFMLLNLNLREGLQVNKPVGSFNKKNAGKLNSKGVALKGRLTPIMQNFPNGKLKLRC